MNIQMDSFSLSSEEEEEYKQNVKNDEEMKIEEVEESPLSYSFTIDPMLLYHLY